MPNNPSPEQVERKSYGFKADLRDNTISGGPAAIGNLDQGNDVIFPGSFNGVLGDFLTNGWVATSHEWDELPIAYPTVAREDGKILYSEAVFHSTQDAQDARTVASERLAAGKNVGLSIGFSIAPDGAHFFDSGEMLLLYAKEKKYDLSLFDQKSILACKDWCRGITQFQRLYEWSIVTSPMNLSAMATACKSWVVPGYKETPTGVVVSVHSTPAAPSRLDIIRGSKSLTDLEGILRDAEEPFSRTESKAFISQTKTLLRDAASDEPAPPADEAAPDAETPPTNDEPDGDAAETGKSDTTPAEVKADEPATTPAPEVEAVNVTRRPDPDAPYGLDVLVAKREVSRLLYADFQTLQEKSERALRMVR